MSSSKQQTSPSEASGHGLAFRNDVEGMRAIAIVAVLLCHAGLSIFAGGYVGVDVFFVISGYLITRLLLGELDRSGSISLRGFYARRARRLLPQSAILLGTVAVLAILIFSPVRAVEVSGDIISSALYTANWHFAAQSVDYFNQGHEPSPVLHLWSLAIEEQFYVVWPTLILAATWFWRRRGRSIRPALWVTLAVISIGSLLLGIHLTDTQPASAYFSTFARAWELGLGAALALLGTVRIPRLAAAAIGWIGVAAILYAVLVFDALTPFPGVAALAPTLGAACLLLAGSSIHSRAKGTPAAVLSLRPVRYVGRISYSWYLWHWPALIFAVALWGALSPIAGIAVVLASLVPTVLTHHLVEDPVRRARTLARFPNRSLALGLGCMAIAVVAGLTLTSVQPTLTTASQADTKGAAALAEQPLPQESADAVRPNPLDAEADHSRIVADGCLVGIAGTRSSPCTYGDPNGTHTLILFGDSHAMQYFPPLELLAKKHHWRLIVLVKRECSPAEVEVQNIVEAREYSQCDTWRERMLRRIELPWPRATVVISSDTAYVAYGNDGEMLSGETNAEALEQGYIATLKRLHGAGRSAVVIRDMPASPVDVPSCVSENLSNLRACAFTWSHDSALEFDVRAAHAAPETSLLDFTPEVCPDDTCRAVIGNALVYRDKFHLTATFARTLSPWLELGLMEDLGPAPASTASSPGDGASGALALRSAVSAATTLRGLADQ